MIINTNIFEAYILLILFYFKYDPVVYATGCILMLGNCVISIERIFILFIIKWDLYAHDLTLCLNFLSAA